MADVQQKYFDAVAAELMGKTIKAGLWARAIAETGSDDGSAKAIYIRLRAEELASRNGIVARPKVADWYYLRVAC